jgi:nicotinamide riboside transporter PnuC
MDWIVGCMTLLSMELIARKKWQGWAVGLVNQALWCYLIVYQQQLWGLALLTVVLTWRYSVALMQWRRDAAKTL